jgi:hypothetical protein
MKRIIVIAFVIMALATAASAQESSKYLGIKGGLNYVKLYGDNVDDAKFMPSFAIGGFYQCEINPRFAISPEIYYSVKGAKDDLTDLNLKLSYIDIPVLFKLMFPTESTAKPCVYAGGYLAFLMSAKIDDFDVKDQTKSTDAGLVVGASVDLMLKEGKQLVNLDFRFTRGLINLDDDGGEDKVYNGGFQFLLGWGFSM